MLMKVVVVKDVVDKIIERMLKDDCRVCGFCLFDMKLIRWIVICIGWMNVLMEKLVNVRLKSKVLDGEWSDWFFYIVKSMMLFLKIVVNEVYVFMI